MARRTPAARPIRVGISSCLLGQKVRYDGGHKRDRTLTDVLGRFVEWVPVCPEVELGLGVPRDTLRLEGPRSGPRLVVRGTGEDITDRMNAWSTRRLRALAGEDLCGYVFKQGSPSCGMERVKRFEETPSVDRGSGRARARGRGRRAGGSARKDSAGLFARALMERWPLLPVEEEGRLNDPALRENFIERVFAYRRFRDRIEAGLTLATSRTRKS